VAGVFAGGTCVRGSYDVARSVGDGRILAGCVDGFLTRKPVNAAQKIFTSTIPRLSAGENLEITKGSNASLTSHELIGEAGKAAGRCWHCDCRAADDCTLRIHSAEYGVNVNEFAGGRRRKFEFIRQPAGVIFEPGKCISCGICVEIAAKAKEPLGLTFIGRGFDVKITVPLNGQIGDGLQKVAEDCVRYCPTGSLAFEIDERTRKVRDSAGNQC
jgi:ferredoxin